MVIDENLAQYSISHSFVIPPYLLLTMPTTWFPYSTLSAESVPTRDKNYRNVSRARGNVHNCAWGQGNHLSKIFSVMLQLRAPTHRYM